MAKLISLAVLALALLTLVPVSEVQSSTATRDNNLAMGNPSAATTSTSNSNNYLMVKSQYAISYNRSKATPNWASWHLSSAWLGSTPRQDDFRADPSLPSSWYRVSASSYSGSGFDRGHLCPSADRTGSVTDNSATFFMTNMMPQSPRNNRQTWENLESYCRTLARNGNELYIICGPGGQGGTGSNGYRTTIDSGRIVVPSFTWKVILILPNGSNDVSRVTTSTRTIAVRVPNDETHNTNWGMHRVSVRSLEQTLGYNFFSQVPRSIQDVIETRVDNGPTR